MIRRLVLTDFVLVDRLELELGPGLNALSGGSGEGKTLVVEALRFLGGAPGGARLVRRGAAEAVVEASLEVACPARRQALAAAGLGSQEWAGSQGPLELLRAVDRRGRSRASAGGAPVALGALRQGGELLLEVFGQGQAPRLVEEARQLEALDACAGCAAEAAAYAAEREDSLRLARERDALAAEERARRAAGAREEDERGALEALAPAANEWDALLEVEGRLSAAGHDLSLLGRSVETLDEDEEHGLGRRLRQVLGDLGRLRPASGASHARRTEALEALEGGLAQVEAAAELLRRERDAFQLDEAEAERVRARLAAWRRTARQVGRAPEALAARWAELQSRPDAAGLRRARRELEARLTAALRALEERASALSRARVTEAERLGEAVAAALPALGMSEGRFQAALSPRPDPGAAGAIPASEGAWEDLLAAEALVLGREPSSRGRERARFLFAAGPETELSPLETASGGELSRLLLALGRELAARGQVPVLVFDEVDANVGARLGSAVGDCLLGMARGRQVLLVTHLAPVAARAARHVRIVREQGRSRAEALEGQARLLELALMIRGAPLTEAAQEQARELLAEAEASRQRLAVEPGAAGVGTARRRATPARRREARAGRERARGALRVGA